MIDLKESYKNAGLEWRTIFWPNWYSANTIRDFMENKELIKPTKNLLPLGILFYNSALVQLESPVTFNEVDYGLGRISDLNSSFEFPMEGYFSFLNNANPIEEGNKLYEVIIKYSPKKDEMRIISYETKGPLLSETVYEKGIEKKLNFGLI